MQPLERAYIVHELASANRLLGMSHSDMPTVLRAPEECLAHANAIIELMNEYLERQHQELSIVCDIESRTFCIFSQKKCSFVDIYVIIADRNEA